MIQLTRLRHDEALYLNPDLIERIDSHVDTVVRLTNGSEYLVCETGEQIVYLIAEYRAKVLALVPIVRVDVPGQDDETGTGSSDEPADAPRERSVDWLGALAEPDGVR